MSHDTTSIERTCPVCNVSRRLDVPSHVAAALSDPNRPAMQDLWPDASAGQREELISGTHEACFDLVTDEED